MINNLFSLIIFIPEFNKAEYNVINYFIQTLQLLSKSKYIFKTVIFMLQELQYISTLSKSKKYNTQSPACMLYMEKNYTECMEYLKCHTPTRSREYGE